MKKLLILGYIIAVLVLSGMVKADGVVESAQINAKTGIMDVEGYLPNTCYQKPSLVVTQIDETKNSVKMTVNSTHLKNVFCAQHTVSFAIVFDLKEIPLSPSKTYAIQFNSNSNSKDDYSYTALPKNSSAAAYKINLQDFKGMLVYVSNPLDPDTITPALKQANQIVPVVSPDMTGDLKKFENKEVRLLGYAVQTATLDNHPLLFQTNGVVTAIIPVSVSR